MEWIKQACVGDRIICIKPIGKGDVNVDPLIVGKVYVILTIEIDEEIIGDVGITLTDIGNDSLYSPVFFKPVQTGSTKAAMALLRSILNGAPVRENEPA